MKAAVIHSFGPPNVIQTEEVAVPVPGPDEVLVKVHAASVNPVDYKTRSGHYPPVKQDRLPLTLGRDIAGRVHQCGSSARKFKLGQSVYAVLDRDHGGYAEYVVVKERDLARMPRHLHYTEAAAVPLAAITAWQGLFDHGGLRAGQRVLIHGGAGGVGHFAIQFAKARGATVATTVGKDDIKFVRGLGADRAIDYKSERFEEAVHDIELVLDLVDGDTQERSWAVLKRGGTLISTLSEPSAQKAHEHAARAEHYMAQPNAAELKKIAALIDAGQVSPRVQSIFPFSHVQVAQQQLEHGHVQGKIVLELDS
jgi:NADPH:quinone reductase-like Zn-dependent oxidoreductase